MFPSTYRAFIEIRPLVSRAICSKLVKSSKTSLSLPQVPNQVVNPQKRHFSDDSGFHDDFKTIRKKYENKEKQGTPYEEIEKFIKKVRELDKILKKQEIASHPVVVFMKGIPEAPRCGFSGLTIRILQEEGKIGNIRTDFEKELKI